MTKVINVSEILAETKNQLTVLETNFAKMREEAEKKENANGVILFDSLIAVVGNMSICHFGLELANKQIGEHPAVKASGGFIDSNNSGIDGETVQSYISSVRNKDRIRDFAIRELLGNVVTIRTFDTVDLKGLEFEEAIAAVIDAGGNPYDSLISQVNQASTEASDIIAKNKDLTLIDFNDDKAAFVLAAVTYQHAFNVVMETPDYIKDLENASGKA